MGVWAGAGVILAGTSIAAIFHAPAVGARRPGLSGVNPAAAARGQHRVEVSLNSPARRTPSVAALLAGLVTIVVAPSALLAAGLVWHGYERAKTQTIENALSTTQLLAARVDRRLTEVVPALQALASSPELARGDRDGFLQHARRFLAANARAVNVTLVDSAGLQVMNTAREPGAPAVPGHPDIVSLLQRGDLAITNLFQGPVLGEPLVAVAVPARIDGRVAYVVGAGLRPRMLDDVVKAPLPAEWTVAVLDRSARIVNRRPWREEFMGQAATPELAGAVRAAASGALNGHTKDGTRVLAIFSRAPQSGYSVAVGVPEQALLAPVRREALVAGGVILAVLLVSLVAAAGIAARIASSMRHLSDSVLDMHKGHVPGAPRLGFREAEQVRLGLNISAAELQQQHSELQGLRDEATAQQLALVVAAIEAAGCPMLVVNGEGELVACNASARAAFGLADVPPQPIHVSDLFVADEGAFGEAVPGLAMFSAGPHRAVARRSRLPIVDHGLACVAITPTEAVAGA